MASGKGKIGAMSFLVRDGRFKLPPMSLDILFRVDAPNTVRQERLASEARAREREVEEQKTRAEEAQRAEDELWRVAEVKRIEDEQRQAEDQVKQKIAEDRKRSLAEFGKERTISTDEPPKKRIKSVNFKIPPLDPDEALATPNIDSGLPPGDADTENTTERARIGMEVMSVAERPLVSIASSSGPAKAASPPVRPRINTAVVSGPSRPGGMSLNSTFTSTPAATFTSSRPLSSSYVPRSRTASTLPTPVLSSITSATRDPGAPAHPGALSDAALRTRAGPAPRTTLDRDAQSTTSTSSSNAANPYIFCSERSGPATFYIHPDVKDAKMWEDRICEKAGAIHDCSTAKHIIFPNILNQPHWILFKTLKPPPEQLSFKTDWLEASLKRGKMVRINDYVLNRDHFFEDAAKIEAEKAARRALRASVDSTSVPGPVPPETTASPQAQEAKRHVPASPPRPPLVAALPVARNSPARDPRAKRKALEAKAGIAETTTATPQSPQIHSVTTYSMEDQPEVTQESTDSSDCDSPDRLPFASDWRGSTTTMTSPVPRAVTPMSPPRYDAHVSPPHDAADNAPLAAEEVGIEEEEDDPLDFHREIFGTSPPASSPEPVSEQVAPTDNHEAPTNNHDFDTPAGHDAPSPSDNVMDEDEKHSGPATQEPKSEGATANERYSAPLPEQSLPPAPSAPVTAEIDPDSDGDYYEILEKPPASMVGKKPKSVSKPMSQARNSITASGSSRPARRSPTVAETTQASSATKKKKRRKRESGRKTGSSPTQTPEQASTSTSVSSTKPDPSPRSNREPAPGSVAPPAPNAPTITLSTKPRATAPGLPRQPSRPGASSAAKHDGTSSGRVAPRPPGVLDMRVPS